MVMNRILCFFTVFTMSLLQKETSSFLNTMRPAFFSQQSSSPLFIMIRICLICLRESVCSGIRAKDHGLAVAEQFSILHLNGCPVEQILATAVR